MAAEGVPPQKGSRNQKKAYRKVARYAQYEANVREEYAHQTSHALVADDACALYVFEDLRVKNMTRRPKAKPDGKGHWLRNGARAKAGLNRAIVASGWGQVVSYTQYKALRAGKLVVLVSLQGSSQECFPFGQTHPGKRPSQAEFVCLRCGHRDNADHNASRVIQRRGIKKVLSGEPLTKAHQRVRMFRQLGPERSQVTPGEIAQAGVGFMPMPQRSKNQELPGVIPETPAYTRNG